jgi:hypothetical protein
MTFIEPAVWVAAGVDLPQGADVDVGVNLCCFQPGVSEHFLNIADIGTAPVHVGGTGVSPQVAGTGFVDAAAVEEFFDPVSQISWAEAGAVAAEEQSALLRQMIEKRSGFGKEAVQPCGGTLADGQHPTFAVLTFSYDQGVGGRIVVAVVQVGHFGPPNAGGVENFEHGAVAQAKGIDGVGDGEQAFDFLDCEGFGQVAGLFTRQVKIGGGIGRNGAGAAEPGKKTPHTTEAGELGIGNQ